jgi:hypothetical protein
VQAYGIPLSTLLTYQKYDNPIEQKALQGVDVSKHMRMLVTNHGGTENGFAVPESTILQWIVVQQKRSLTKSY